VAREEASSNRATSEPLSTRVGGGLRVISRRPPLQDAGEDEASLMTAKDVAAYLQLPRKKVYDVVGTLALSLGARRLRWRRAEIDGWLEAQRRTR
jgi:predicted DNA-binding transcriptional regulator AlpA